MDKDSMVRRIVAHIYGDNAPEEDPWLTREQVASICPPCAKSMENFGISKIKAQALFSQASLAQATAVQIAAKKKPGLPKGWTTESAKKFWKSVTEGKEHKMTACINALKDKEGIDNPGAVCRHFQSLAGAVK